MIEQSAAQVVVPKSVRFIQVVVFIQAVMTLLGVALAIYDVSERFDHNQDVTSLSYLAIGLSLLVAGLLLVSAICLAASRPWVRPLVVTAEVFVVLSGLGTIVLGNPLGFVTIIFGLCMAAALFGSGFEEWLESIQPAGSRY